ncbi:MAG: cupin domain-containing protein, partial [Candidatus Thermoplasmatota archaeon]|nr:cupin domain-containing protein [Candidatus Thermoplasmatota archaeon]
MIFSAISLDNGVVVLFIKIKNFFNHKGEECGVILEGKLKGIIGGQVVVLEEGDSIYLDSSI